MKIVALEEHFATAEVMQGWKSVDPQWSDMALKSSTEGESACRLLDLGTERLNAMDGAGIDVAVLFAYHARRAESRRRSRRWPRAIF